MLPETKNFILSLSESDMRKIDVVLCALRSLSYEKMEWERGELYRAKLDTVERDIHHIKEII